MGFHGIRMAPFQITQVFNGIPWNIPWNSMELWCHQMKYYLIPWHSMKLWDCHFIQYNVILDLHGSRQIKKSPSSMGFHRIRRAPFQMTQVFHGIPWNIPWNSMELWYRQMKYNLVPWNAMEYSMEYWCRQMHWILLEECSYWSMVCYCNNTLMLRLWLM